MKNFILLLLIFIHPIVLLSQKDTTTAGKIVYYEGKVELGNDPEWTRAKINTPVRRNQLDG